MVEILTRDKPFLREPNEKYNWEKFEFILRKDCPYELYKVCRDCSEWDPNLRPTMKSVIERLTSLIESIKKGTALSYFQAVSQPTTNDNNSESTETETEDSEE